MQRVVIAKSFWAAAVTGASLALTAPAAAAPAEAGLWIDDTGKGAVRIELCGDKLCGRIVWLKDPLNDEGQPKFDKYNPSPELRARPICGLPILGDLAPVPEGGFDGGWVYDPKVGKSYDVAVQLASPDVLQVTGYKGLRLLGKTFNWTRAKTELPTCETTPASLPSQGAAPPNTKAAAAPSGALKAATPSATPKSAVTTKPAPNAPASVAAGQQPGTPAKPAPAPAATQKNQLPAKPASTAQAATTAKKTSKPAAQPGSQEAEVLPWEKKTSPSAGQQN